ncbi:MAG: hypothetical protein Cons2KO_21760 [Congregibacter sp.]
MSPTSTAEMRLADKQLSHYAPPASAGALVSGDLQLNQQKTPKASEACYLDWQGFGLINSCRFQGPALLRFETQNKSRWIQPTQAAHTRADGEAKKNTDRNKLRYPQRLTEETQG